MRTHMRSHHQLLFTKGKPKREEGFDRVTDGRDEQIFSYFPLNLPPHSWKQEVLQRLPAASLLGSASDVDGLGDSGLGFFSWASWMGTAI